MGATPAARHRTVDRAAHRRVTLTDIDEGPVRLSPKQAQSIIDARRRVNIWHGSVSSGKTIASIIAWLNFIATDAPTRGELLMIGVTLQSLERNVLNVIAEMDPAIIDHTAGSNVAIIFGRTVVCLGANDQRAERRIRGVTAAGVYIDEASLMPGEGYWAQIMNRLRVPGARLFATTNPDNPTHWLKVIIDQANELGYAVWHFVLADNPGLTADYIAAVSRENIGLWYARNILGEWVLADGVIWGMWDETTMLYTDAEQPDISGWVVSIDPGAAGVFSAHLTGCGADQRLYVAAELRFDHRGKQAAMTDVDFSRAITAWLDELDPATNAIPSRCPGARTPEHVFIDPSGVTLRTQLYRDGWAGVREADNAVIPGIRMVGSLMGADRIRVHESCVGLRGEIPGYVWDPKAAMLGVDKPIKANDHSCDDLRYMVAGTTRWWRHWLSADA